MHKNSFGIAIDIGTTTLGFALVDLESGETIKETGLLNGQKKYGADVISRIRYGSTKEGLQAMKAVLQEDIETGIEAFINYAKDEESIRKIVFNGNTVMLHILMEYPLESLGAYPFTPYSTKEARLPFHALFPNQTTNHYPNAICLITPSADAFFGGDVLMGAAYLGLGKNETYDMLIDLGTNGELLIVNKEKGVFTSTACGSAFERNINAKIKSSDIFSHLYHALRKGIVDKDGCITPPFLEKGIDLGEDLILTQNRIRKFQLAKAGIAAGMLLLPKQLGIDYEEIEHIDIAGGFGFHLNIRHAVELGMLPEKRIEKYKAVGNASLKAAIEILKEESILEYGTVLKERIDGVQLAEIEAFEEVYVREMRF